jgi:glycosyltransferase involved in cell wall biosynthesis
MSPVVAVVYAHNEKIFLPHTLDQLTHFKKKGLIKDILVIDDASTDSTVAIARKFGAKVVTHEKQLGKRGCFVSGINAAKKMGAEVMLSLDADLELFPEATLREMLERTIKSKVGMVVASQYERMHDYEHEPRQFPQDAKVKLDEFEGYYTIKGHGFANNIDIYAKVEANASNAQRAIRLDTLNPYFNGNARWKMILEKELPKEYHPLGKWGLEAALDQLIPKNKTLRIPAPIFARPVGTSEFRFPVSAQRNAHESMRRFTNERIFRMRHKMEEREINKKTRPTTPSNPRTLLRTRH